MAGALSHVKVLDLSRVLAGPWAGQILADLGAEVIKVERPGAGDDTRAWGPPWLKDQDGKPTREAGYYLAANRNKRSIAIDIASAEGQSLIRKLALEADILIENFKVGGLRKYGLDYASLSADHPGLIYCSITGFGQDGPFSKQAGYDFLVQGMSGLMSITGAADGPPQKVGTAVADLTTGMYGVIGILAALAHRSQTGRGQHVDMSLLDTQLSWLANQNMNYLIGGTVPMRRGNDHPNIVPYQDFPTSNGHIIICAGNDGQFRRFAQAIGAPELATDPDFATNEGRVTHRDRLVPLIEQVLLTRTTEEWLQVLEDVNVPHGPINTIPEAFDHPQVKHRNIRIDLPHPLAGSVPGVACPVRLSETPPEYISAPPLLGQHTDEILAALGLSEEERDRLRDAGVVQ